MHQLKCTLLVAAIGLGTLTSSFAAVQPEAPACPSIGEMRSLKATEVIYQPSFGWTWWGYTKPISSLWSLGAVAAMNDEPLRKMDQQQQLDYTTALFQATVSGTHYARKIDWDDGYYFWACDYTLPQPYSKWDDALAVFSEDFSDQDHRLASQQHSMTEKLARYHH